MFSQENGEDHDFVVKVVLIGDSAVGKTNILSRFCKDEFSVNSHSTVGVEFASKIMMVSEKKVKVQIWDTAGQERFKAITNTYYYRAKGAVVVFDITKFSSFQNVDKWVEDLRQVTGKEIVIVLVGNKSDLKLNRAVTKEEALEKAKILGGLPYLETSALNNTHITETFTTLIQSKLKIFKNILVGIYDLYLSKSEENVENELNLRNSFSVGTNNQKQNGPKSKCC
jgi:small GTP-binding protein